MARIYYCLVAGLPEIFIDQNKLSFSQLDFKEELKELFHTDDYKLVELFFLPIDNNNLLNLVEKSDVPFIEGGKYLQAELEDEIKDPANLESYIISFINAHKEEMPFTKGMSWENQLTTLYYKYVLNTENKFIKKWFIYDFQLNNIITALNCRKFKMPMEKELIEDNNIVEQLVKNTSKDFGLSSEIPIIEKLVVWFEGIDANAADRMFVALGNAVVYHPDDTVTQKFGWNEWIIDLQEFATQGADLTNVGSITLGFGTRGAPVPTGGTGTVYFDDIRLIQ